jgi:hypothetical protein
MFSNELTYRTITAEFERSSNMSPNSWSTLYASQKRCCILFLLNKHLWLFFLGKNNKGKPSEKIKSKRIFSFHFFFQAYSCFQIFEDINSQQWDLDIYYCNFFFIENQYK